MVKGRTEPFVSRVGPVLVVVLVIDPFSSPKKTKIEDDDEEDWEGAVKSAFHLGASWHCHRSADWQSAVPRIGNPPTCRIPFGETADCQSALQCSLDPYRW